jgi:hypothetical protein
MSLVTERRPLPVSRIEIVAGVMWYVRSPWVVGFCARVEFEHAQRVEETFHKDFDGLDLTMLVTRIRTIAPPVFFSIATIQK